MSAIDRVRRVLAAGARIADASDELGAEARTRLLTSSNLSRDGIELALADHLERAASNHELERFVGLAGDAARCHVVLSANVCTAALRAMAFAVATANDVVVRPSRRDPVVAELVVRALAADASFARAGGKVVIAPELDVAPGDELHVYGSDEAVAEYARRAPGAVVRGHGTGFGVAFIGVAADVDDAAAALARDVVPFDQQGCLSARIAFVDGDAARAERFARALDAELARLGRAIPRGRLDEAAERDGALYRASAQALSGYFGGAEHGVGLDLAPRALTLPPAARVVHVLRADAATARALLEPFWKHVAIAGVVGDAAAVAQGFTCRVTEVGSMQKPPFDGPVDLRPYRSLEAAVRG